MDKPNEVSDTARVLRFRFKSMLLFVALCGLAAAWFSDHSRQGEHLRRLQTANSAQRDQIRALKQRLSTRSSAVQFIYWWASADDFIAMLKTAANEETFLARSPSLAGADQLVVDDAVGQLLGLLGTVDETTTSRALTSLRFTQNAAPDKLAGHAASIVSSVLPLLDSDSDRSVAESIAVLESFGAAAIEAVPSLQERMNDDGDWHAPAAAIAIAKIEPATRIGPRLAELVRIKHPNWYHAAFHLPRYVDADTAERVLNDAYAAAQNDAERRMATLALNQIPAQ